MVVRRVDSALVVLRSKHSSKLISVQLKVSSPIRSAVVTSLKIDLFMAAWFSLLRLLKYKKINNHAVCIRARGSRVEASESSPFLYNFWMTSVLRGSLCTVPASLRYLTDASGRHLVFYLHDWTNCCHKNAEFLVGGALRCWSTGTLIDNKVVFSYNSCRRFSSRKREILPDIYFIHRLPCFLFHLWTLTAVETIL